MQSMNIPLLRFGAGPPKPSGCATAGGAAFQHLVMALAMANGG